MGRPRPYLGDDNRWHDPVRGFESEPFIDAHDAEERRIALQRVARDFEAKALFYKAIEQELSGDGY